jgi:N-methylhydantoinase A/oxoprolinase/acetone carboxylase beta subunit
VKPTSWAIAATTEALQLAKSSGAESIAICLLHSFRNDIHERAVAAMSIGRNTTPSAATRSGISMTL